MPRKQIGSLSVLSVALYSVQSADLILRPGRHFSPYTLVFPSCTESCRYDDRIALWESAKHGPPSVSINSNSNCGTLKPEIARQRSQVIEKALPGHQHFSDLLIRGVEQLGSGMKQEGQ